MPLINRVFWLIDKLPLDLRKKLHGVQFIVEKDAFNLTEDGNYVKALTLGKNQIVFFEPFIGDDEDLKKTLIHELCHHFGMNEEEVQNFMKI